MASMVARGISLERKNRPLRTARWLLAMTACVLPAACGPHLAPPRPRSEAIRLDAEAIRAECEHAAGGDWDRWQRQTAPYRQALRDRIQALKDYPPGRSNFLEGSYEALAGRDDFPLFEVGSRTHLSYLYDDTALDGFRRDRAVVAAHRWLRERGVDLIFVPVPKMTEIYIEHFIDPCPPDGVIAPHVRRALLELLEADVEVVDGRRLFRPLREPDPEYLYNTGDTHWAPRAMRVMAMELATRIRRYEFGLAASRRSPIVKTETGPYLRDGLPGGIGSGGGWQALNERQQSLAKAVQTTTQVCVTMPSGELVAEDLSSPVFLLGHSYTLDFREQLIKELNLFMRNRGSATTEGFADFLRDPELLAGCRVLVWITTEQHMTHYDPLPPPILAALTDDRATGREGPRQPASRETANER